MPKYLGGDLRFWHHVWANVVGGAILLALVILFERLAGRRFDGLHP